MTFATHPERQFMDYLRGRGWVKGTTLPASRLTVSLQKRGWIEQQVQGPKNEIFYRMTDIGLKALRSPVPAGRPSKTMTEPRPAGHRWTLTDDDMLRKLLASGMKQRLIAQKMKRSIGAIQTRIYLFKKPRKLQRTAGPKN